MKKIIALVSVLVLCMACVSTAMAQVTGFRYTIDAGKEGYGPSSIYTKSRGGYTAEFTLDIYEVDGYSAAETIKVHLWNRQLGKQVTSRLSVDTCSTITLMYLTRPTTSQTLKPVTYKTNSDDYSKDVTITGSFDP